MTLRVAVVALIAVTLSVLAVRPASAAELELPEAQIQLDLDRGLVPAFDVDSEGAVKVGSILLVIGAAVAVGGAAIAIAGKVALDWAGAATTGPALIVTGVIMVVAGVAVALIGVVVLATQIANISRGAPPPKLRPLPARRPLIVQQPVAPEPFLAFSF